MIYRQRWCFQGYYFSDSTTKEPPSHEYLVLRRRPPSVPQTSGHPHPWAEQVQPGSSGPTRCADLSCPSARLRHPRPRHFRQKPGNLAHIATDVANGRQDVPRLGCRERASRQRPLWNVLGRQAVKDGLPKLGPAQLGRPWARHTFGMELAFRQDPSNQKARLGHGSPHHWRCSLWGSSPVHGTRIAPHVHTSCLEAPFHRRGLVGDSVAFEKNEKGRRRCFSSGGGESLSAIVSGLMYLDLFSRPTSPPEFSCAQSVPFFAFWPSWGFAFGPFCCCHLV